MSGQPGVIRESRVENRPRNPDVERAWKDYAQAFEEWQRILNASHASLVNEFKNTDDARMIALRMKNDAKNEALFVYFEAFDRDQHEHE